MTWQVNDKEFEQVLSLPGHRRYQYFVKRVADRGLVWSLAGEGGWALAGDDEGRELVPVWPHPRFASAAALREWAGLEPRSIDIHTWLDRWTPGMVRDGRLVAVLPTPADRGVAVSPERLKEDLQAELSLIE